MAEFIIGKNKNSKLFSPKLLRRISLFWIYFKKQENG